MPPKACRDFLVLPPEHEDEKVSDHIFEIWRDRVGRMLGSCDDILDFEGSKDTFDLFGISHETPFEVDRFTSSQMQDLTERSVATHIVQLNDRIRRGRIFFKVKAYKMPEFFPVKIAKVTRSWSRKLRQAELISGITDPWAVFGVSLIPNSLLFGFSTSTISNVKTDEEYREVDFKKKSFLPPLISGFGITRTCLKNTFST